jgi:DNA-directed RNA polymerase specialized sigma24 family protein
VPALRLHNVDDASAFCCAIVSRSGLNLSFHDREDLEEFLLAECWRLSLRYQPGGPKDFDGWAARILRVRVVDWQRSRFGRTRYRYSNPDWNRDFTPPSFVSYDGLDESLATGPGDPADDCDPAFAGLLATEDRQRARDLRTLGLEPPRRAA